MPSFARFEDIEAWKQARQLTRAAHESSSNARFSGDFDLRDQVRRAAVSVMANIAEGLGRSGDREFLQFLAMAKASTHEVISHLYVALDQGYMASEEFEGLRTQARDVGRIIGGLMEYLRRSGMRGSRFRPDERSRTRLRTVDCGL